MVLILKLIVVIIIPIQLLETKIIAQQQIFAEKMKGIVILMMSVRLVLFVDQTIAQIHLVLIQKWIVVIHALVTVLILIIKETALTVLEVGGGSTGLSSSSLNISTCAAVRAEEALWWSV